jgi:hypothetical protein
VKKVQAPVLVAVKALAVHSARYPQRTIVAIIFISVGIFVVGLLTNFSIEVDEDVLCKYE